MTQPDIAFIGIGHMANSFIGGLVADGYPIERIHASDIHPEKCQKIADDFGICANSEKSAIAQHKKVLILAVKPQQIQGAIEELKTIILRDKPLLISIAAGVRLASIERWIGIDLPIVRAMPNTPALLRSGITALFANQHVNNTQRNIAEAICRAVGTILWMDEESQLDVVTALSGSGPAYFFSLIQALVDTGQQLGLHKEQAHLLTVETALGAARMALEADTEIKTLLHEVASPGGTTEKVIQSLTHNHLHHIIRDALQAGHQRAQEIADLIDQHTQPGNAS